MHSTKPMKGIFEGRRKNKMTKQAILENVLDMFLTSKQMAYIADEWKAFYTDPLKYKDSVVVDMVNLSLEGIGN